MLHVIMIVPVIEAIQDRRHFPGCAVSQDQAR